MSIKSDIWLRKMAAEHEMITPFLPELVREVGGSRIISAGTSSYGYDMRLADDGFKTFPPSTQKRSTQRFNDQYSLVEPETANAEVKRATRRRIITGSA